MRLITVVTAVGMLLFGNVVPDAQAQAVTCSSFKTQAEAQQALREEPVKRVALDGDKDGIGCESLPCPCDKTPVKLYATVKRIVSGHTVEVWFADNTTARVRFVGVTAPALDECGGDDAVGWVEFWLLDKSVELERDVSHKDEYGRLLRHVWFEHAATQRIIMVGARLVALGFARATPYPPDVKWAKGIAGYEREARASGEGLWSTCWS